MLTSIDTPFGQILLENKDSGYFYFSNKIKEKYSTKYGYSFNFEYCANQKKYFEEVAHMWNYVFTNLTDKEINYGIILLQKETEDIKYFNLFPIETIDNIYQHVQKLCNVQGGIPVTSKEQQRELEYFGKSCIIVSKSCQRLLAKTLGTFEEIKKKVTKPKFKIVNVTDKEKELLNMLIDDINESYWCATRDRVKICEFKEDYFYGLHSAKDGTIYINKDILDNYKELLITLIHEFSHDFGVDGVKLHVEAIQTIFAELLERKK